MFECKNAFQTLVLDGLVRDSSLHIQRNALNILNVVLSDVSVFEGERSKNSVSQNRMRQSIVELQGHVVLDRLSKILETHTNEIVRAKAALSISLLLIRRHDLMLRACVKLHLPAVLTGTFNLVCDHKIFSARGEDEEDEEEDDVSYVVCFGTWNSSIYSLILSQCESLQTECSNETDTCGNQSNVLSLSSQNCRQDLQTLHCIFTIGVVNRNTRMSTISTERDLRGEGTEKMEKCT